MEIPVLLKRPNATEIGASVDLARSLHFDCDMSTRVVAKNEIDFGNDATAVSPIEQIDADVGPLGGSSQLIDHMRLEDLTPVFAGFEKVSTGPLKGVDRKRNINGMGFRMRETLTPRCSSQIGETMDEEETPEYIEVAIDRASVEIEPIAEAGDIQDSTRHAQKNVQEVARTGDVEVQLRRNAVRENSRGVRAKASS